MRIRVKGERLEDSGRVRNGGSPLRTSFWGGALLVALALPAVVSCESRPATRAKPRDAAPPALRLPSDVVPRAYDLALDLDGAKPTFSGEVRIKVSLARSRRVIWLHGKDLKPSSVRVLPQGGTPIAATYEEIRKDGLVRLSLGRPVGPGLATIRIRYSGPLASKAVGLFRVRSGKEWYIFSQFQQIHARRAFPVFDEPVFKTPFRLTLTVPRSYKVTANTLPQRERLLPGERRRIWFRTTADLPAYLVAVAAGPFDIIRATDLAPGTVRRPALPLRGFAARGRGDKLATALRWVRQVVTRLESYLGIAYPFTKLDLIAVPGFSMAMENAGAITFGEPYLLLDPATATVTQQRAVASLLTHEVSHQWFGNLVTMAWWDDSWLNEAFATWAEARIVSKWRPQDQAPLQGLADIIVAMKRDGFASSRSVRQPVRTVDEIASAFDAITYYKGAAVLRMFERYVGAASFRAAIRRYLSQFAGKTATAESFLQSLDRSARRGVARSMRSFLDQAGLPLLSVRSKCAGSGTVVDLGQQRYLPLGSRAPRTGRWEIPVCLRFARSGRTQRHCVLMKTRRARVTLPGRGCATWIHPNADGSGYYRFALSRSDLLALVKGMGKLTKSERISLADGLHTALGQARLSVAETLVLLKDLSRFEELHLVASIIDTVKLALEFLTPAAERARVRRRAGALLRPLALRLGFAGPNGEPPSRRDLRRHVLAFMVDVARDPVLVRRAAQLGWAFLKGGREKVAADVVPVALLAAVRHGGEAAFQAVLGRLRATRGTTLRKQLVHALAQTLDPTLARRARDLTLDTSIIDNNECLELLWVQSRVPEHRHELRQWVRAHFTQLAERILDFNGRVMVYFAAGNVCSKEGVADLRRKVRPLVVRVQGAPRALDQQIENGEICAARVRAHARLSRHVPPR